MKKIEEYEINYETAAIVGMDKKSTKIVENNQDYYLDCDSYSIMERSCEYFGSSYDGRCKGSKKMLGIKYKVPIIIEESNNIIFFPISEVENYKCTWIALKWFDRVVEEENNTYIYFKNGKKIRINASKYSVENQVLRSSKLHLLLSERKNKEI